MGVRGAVFWFSQNSDAVFRSLTFLRFAVLCGFSVFAEFSYSFYRNIERFFGS